MAPSEFLRVEHNLNGKIVTDPIEFANLQYTGDGHTTSSKAKDNSDSKKPRKRRFSRRRRAKETQTKSLQDALNKDLKNKGFNPNQHNHD